MLPAIKSNPKFNHVVVSTGNILNVNNKLGSKSNEELLDGLKLTLLCCDSPNHVQLNEDNGQVLRATEELSQKLTENGRSDISIGAKIFLNRNSSEFVSEAVSTLLQILQVQSVDNVVLAYHPKSVANATPTATSGATVKWNGQNKEAVHELQKLWASLEQFAKQRKISQLGISDLDIETLTQLHSGALVPPTIAQINLASCCVVPLPLKNFCAQHDIQLLTHSDPEILLDDDDFIMPDYAVDWILRYLVHVRCRGVLTAKGYIVGASRLQAGAPAVDA